MSTTAPPATYAVDGLTPSTIIEPSSIEELSFTLCDANNRGAAVIPWGAGRHMSIGNVPAQYDIALRTTNLNRVIEYEPADMTVTVAAGITFGALQSLLAEHGQFLPIDAPAGATIGGVLAANVSGPSRHAYGLPRDWLIGCRLVLADGTIIKGGGRVVKNVAGYDIPKLAVGSLGTLGVIAEATFKLAPLPPVQETLLVRCETIEDAARLVFAADQRSLALRAAAIHVGEAFRPPATTPQHDAPLDVLAAFWLAGTSAAVERTRHELEQLSTTERGDDSMWSPPAVPLGAVTLKVSLLPSQIVDFGARMADRSEAFAAYPTTGLAVVTLGSGEAEAVVAMIDETRRYVTPLGGSLVVTSAPPEVKQRIDVWGPVDSLETMRALKHQFDPKSTLNRGRYVGGI